MAMKMRNKTIIINVGVLEIWQKKRVLLKFKIRRSEGGLIFKNKEQATHKINS